MVDGVTTTYLLDTATPLTMVLAEQTGTDPAIFYLHGFDLVAQSDGATTEYFAYDGLGSVRQVADAIGSPLLTQTFDPYGSLYARAGIAETAWGFTGEYGDTNGLLYLRARYYAPSQGRFFQLDPSRQEVNPYQYSSSNPLKFTDPSGFSPEYPDMVEGREIHNRIERCFRSCGLSLGKEVDTEVYIQNASKQHVIRVYSEEDGFFALVEDPSEPVGNFGRADLVDFSAHQVYEIKHVRSWQYGYAEARWYQGRMELDPNPIFAGNWFLGINSSQMAQSS